MSSKLVAAVDVGGTSIKGTIWDLTRGEQTRIVRPANAAAGPAAVVHTIEDLVADLVGCSGVKALGVVVPGLINDRDGVAIWSENLRWRDLALRGRLEQRFGLPVALGKDSIAAGVAEFLLGAGRGSANGMFIPIGTGIGGAVLVGGEPYLGAHGRAGEIGHTVVRPDGPACVCGQVGCVEAIASGSAIERTYQAHTGERLRLSAILERAQTHESIAAGIWQNACEALGSALIQATILLDLDTIVLGGGVIAARERLLHPIRSHLAAHIPWADAPSIRGARLGGDSGVMGAAIKAWHQLGISSTALASATSAWLPGGT